MTELIDLRNNIIFYLLTVKKKIILNDDTNKISYHDFLDYILDKFIFYKLVDKNDQDVILQFEKKIVNHMNDLIDKYKKLQNYTNDEFLDLYKFTPDLRYISMDNLDNDGDLGFDSDADFSMSEDFKDNITSHPSPVYRVFDSFISSIDSNGTNFSNTSNRPIQSKIKAESRYSNNTIKPDMIELLNTHIDLYIFNNLSGKNNYINFYKDLIKKENKYILFIKTNQKYGYICLFLIFNFLLYFTYDPEIKYNIANDYIKLSRKSIIFILVNMVFAILTVTDFINDIIISLNSIFYKRFVIRQDMMIFLHKAFGLFAIIFTIIHVIGHISILITFYGKNRVCLENEFKFSKLNVSISTFRIYLSFPYITGYILLFILLLNAVIFYTKRWAVFYFFHRYSSLLFIFITCIHGYKRWLGALFAWKILLPFTLIFIVEKYKKYFYAKYIKIIDVYKKEKYIVLSFKRIMKKNLMYDYIFINIPKLSYFEWHPFTTIYKDNSIFKLYIYNVGIWTNKLYKNIKIGDKVFISKNKKNDLCYINSYSYVVIFATGISINAFESLFNDYINKRSSDKNKAVYIIWSVNNLEIVHYYRDKLSILSNDPGIFKIFIYLTLKFDNEIDKKIIGSMYLYDILKLNKCELYFERPKYKILLKYILYEINFKKHASFLKNDTIAFYYSGNPYVSDIIQKKIKKYNNNTTRLKYKFIDI